MRPSEFSSLIGLSIIIVCAFGGAAKAQLDPSSALLMNGNAPTDSGGAAIDSGRYTIRPKAEPSPAPVPRALAKRAKSDGSDLAPVTVTIPNSTPIPMIPTPVLTSASVSVTPAKNTKSSKPESKSSAPSTPVLASVTRPAELLRIDHFLDLGVSLGYLYNGSDSTYSFRNYSIAAPVVAGDANVWVTPTFGVHGSYMTSYNGSVSDSNNGSRNVAVSETWLNLGIRGREFFGSDLMAPSLTFGIDYINFGMQTSSDAKTRESLLSSGVKLSLEAEIPVSYSRSWTIGMEISPFLSHSEGTTSINFQSGTGNSAVEAGLSIGSRYRFSRSETIFFKLSESIERDLFSGSASLVDPVTGAAPSNVSVTNSFTILQFGYSWGD